MHMEFSTPITIPQAASPLSYGEKIVTLGSCFAENIGLALEENKFSVDKNPFGILYNPASVAAALRCLLRPERYTSGDLFLHEGVYHSFAHHSRFSSPSEETCLSQINDRLFRSADYLRQAGRLIVTFGTAWVYKLKSDGRIVSNCHKLPDKLFERSRLSVEDIAAEWEPLLLSIWEQCPDLKVLFTVSPIRHWKDGAHANQLSKSTLLLAIERLQERFGDRTTYFPAYEIVLDELRDYRYYAEDMLHPSPLAMAYIWERFARTQLTEDTRRALNEWKEIRKAVNHRPFQPGSEAYREFILQTLLKAERFQEKMPSFDLTNEIQLLKSKLK